jgi:hypothetical protein
MEAEVQVGKYTLESLTTGMYSDPKIVYREYIQNSVDSLENAVQQGIIEQSGMRIDIIVSEENSRISIRDNGTGIKRNEAQATLMNVGNSKKRNANNRGFRGIGRLGGMSYCDTLVFSTSYEGENCKTIITFDCKKLKKLLVPGQYDDLSLSDVLGEIMTIEVQTEKSEKHYFVVEMENVSGSSDLLNIDAAKSYISQVAPLPYQTRHFIYISQLKEYLKDHGYGLEEFPIFVGEEEADLEPVYKPNKSRFRADRNKKTVDEISSMNYFDVTIDGELYALGWYGNCGWYGFLSDREISGLRVRKGNILIGDSMTLNGIFKESRFNGWTQGEIFIVTDKLVPNARRDDFEQNDVYCQFIEVLSSGVAIDIARAIREASQTRNDPSMKVLKEMDKKIAEATIITSDGFNSSVDKEKLVEELEAAVEKLKKTKVKDEYTTKKDELCQKLEETVNQVASSNNYKINKISSGIDKKSKNVLKTVSDILSKKLSKFLVDEIIAEIIAEINGK